MSARCCGWRRWWRRCYGVCGFLLLFWKPSWCFVQAVINVRGIRCMFVPSSLSLPRMSTPPLTAPYAPTCAVFSSSGAHMELLQESSASPRRTSFLRRRCLISHGAYIYLQMVAVLELVVFSITIGAQSIAFPERVSKAVQATSDLERVLAFSVTDMD
jgi:hypothetical protein